VEALVVVFAFYTAHHKPVLHLLGELLGIKAACRGKIRSCLDDRLLGHEIEEAELN
jgi:hypothetical protein